VVVAAGGDERGAAGDEGHEFEAEHVAVEGEPALEVADVQVEVTDREAGPGLAARSLAGHGGEQVVQVEGLRAAGVPQRFGPRPARTVGGQLDAVAVGIGEVDSLVLAVVGGALYQGLRRR
jgi:hypothetical protein